MFHFSRTAVVFCVLVASAAIAGAQEYRWVYGHTGAVVPADAKDFDDFTTPTETVVANGLTFRLFYEDVRSNTNVGFDGPDATAARQRMRETLEYLGGVLNETGTLDIYFEVSETDASGFLAAAGSLYNVAPGFQKPTSLERLETGTKPAAQFPEINVIVDFGYSYNFTSGPPTSGQFSFFAVMLHEITHGLGIASLTASNGLSQFAPSSPTTRTNWDRQIVKGQGGAAIFSVSGVLNLLANITSNDLFFNGAEANAEYDGSAQPGIYAPGPFASGSSLSHWDTGNIDGGAIMEHAVAPGISGDKQGYAPVDVGALRDMGYPDAALPAVDGPEVRITNNGNAYVEENGSINLEAVVTNATAVSYQWTKDGADIPSEDNATFQRNSITIADSGAYRVRVDVGAKALITSDPVIITVFPVGGVPVGGAIGLAATAVACAFAGGIRIRRKR